MVPRNAGTGTEATSESEESTTPDSTWQKYYYDNLCEIHCTLYLCIFEDIRLFCIQDAKTFDKFVSGMHRYE